MTPGKWGDFGFRYTQWLVSQSCTEENDVDREKLKSNSEEHLEELPGIY